MREFPYMRRFALLLTLSSGTFSFASVSVSAPANGSHCEFDGAVCGIGKFLVRQRRLRHGNLYGA